MLNWKAKIGLLLVAEDMTIEPEINELVPQGVAVYAARMTYSADITPTGLRQLYGQIEKATKEIIWANPNVICFACTSGSIVIGNDRVKQSIERYAPDVRATTTSEAVVHALRRLAIKNVAVGTPYIDELNRMEKDYLELLGFQVVNVEGLQLRDGPQMSMQSPETIYQLAERVDRRDADGVFLSCTGLYASPIIDKLERKLGKPVVSSNTATCWHALRLAGIGELVQGAGRLLRLP